VMGVSFFISLIIALAICAGYRFLDTRWTN
jgi:hypothetical protein